MHSSITSPTIFPIPHKCIIEAVLPFISIKLCIFWWIISFTFELRSENNHTINNFLLISVSRKRVSVDKCVSGLFPDKSLEGNDILIGVKLQEDVNLS